MTGGGVSFADVQDDSLCSHRLGGEEGAIEDQMRASGHEQPVLLAARLTFGAVDKDHSRPFGCGYRSPFQAGRIIRATSPCQPAGRDEVDERASGGGQWAEPADVLREPFGS